MVDSKCLNCGANLDVSTPEDYVKCKYCNSILANYNSFKSIQRALSDTASQDEINQLAKLLTINDYEGLQQLSEKILAVNPLSFVAMTYKAIAYFWLGYDNFSHLNEILEILGKADKISERNEFVIRAREAICNDIVVLAAKNEIYGDDLVNSLKAFAVATQIAALKSESKAVLANYCTSVFERYRQNLEELVQKQKKDYDPPAQTIVNLVEMVKYVESDKEKLEFIYLHAKHHLSKNKSKSHYAKTVTILSDIESILGNLKSDVKGKNLVFNFLGKLIIK